MRAAGTAVRLFVLAFLMGSTAIIAGRAAPAEVAVAREPLAAFPLTLDGWQGRDHAALSEPVLAELGVDDYLDRSYRRDGASVALYVGYYASQRQGDAAHSPLNCLPGTGWVPLESGYLTIPGAGEGGSATVRRLRVRRGADEALVLYWYQSRGRIVANEYWNKAYLMYDAVRLNRTDTALVRVFSMVDGPDGEDRALEGLLAFVSSALPRLAGPHSEPSGTGE